MRQESADRPDLDATGLSVGVVAARFNRDIVDRLVEGALRTLDELGAETTGPAWVPGAFELPLVAGAMAATGDHDAIIALGAVIRGETAHFDHVARVAADGIAAISREHGIPVGFGVLTTDTREQALARSGGDVGDLGEEAARTAVEVARLLEAL